MRRGFCQRAPRMQHCSISSNRFCGTGGTHVGTQSPLNPSAAANVYTSTPAPEGEEDRLVDSICTPGGLRAQPDKADLQTFVESLGNLDGDKLVELLTHKMVGHQLTCSSFSAWQPLCCQDSPEKLVWYNTSPLPVVMWKRCASDVHSSVWQAEHALMDRSTTVVLINCLTMP